MLENLAIHTYTIEEIATFPKFCIHVLVASGVEGVTFVDVPSEEDDPVIWDMPGEVEAEGMHPLFDLNTATLEKHAFGEDGWQAALERASAALTRCWDVHASTVRAVHDFGISDGLFTAAERWFVAAGAGPVISDHVRVETAKDDADAFLARLIASEPLSAEVDGLKARAMVAAIDRDRAVELLKKFVELVDGHPPPDDRWHAAAEAALERLREMVAMSHGDRKLMEYVAEITEHNRKAWLGAHGALAKGKRTIRVAGEIRVGDVIDNNDDHTPARVTRVDVMESGQSVNLWCGQQLWYKRDPNDPVCVVKEMEGATNRIPDWDAAGAGPVISDHVRVEAAKDDADAFLARLIAIMMSGAFRAADMASISGLPLASINAALDRAAAAGCLVKASVLVCDSCETEMADGACPSCEGQTFHDTVIYIAAKSALKQLREK